MVRLNDDPRLQVGGISHLKSHFHSNLIRAGEYSYVQSSVPSQMTQDSKINVFLPEITCSFKTYLSLRIL